MKKIYLTFLIALLAFSAQAQNDPFITTWEVDSDDLSITIPTEGTGYDYTIDFGDGTVLNNVTGDATHTYNASGTYTVSIWGDFPRIYFEINTTTPELLSIEQWGDIQWTSMERAFAGCENMVLNATDIPDLSQVTDMSEMFFNAISFNQSINNWDVSNVTNMKGTFFYADSFNQSLDNWDVSGVINMSTMFNSATSFNQSLNNWDVSNVIDMKGMFMYADSFNQSLNDWNVSSVTIMQSMFRQAVSFNQPLNNWDVSNVINMHSMFQYAVSFNRPLNNWNVSSVGLMGYMFNGAESFNQNLTNWEFKDSIYDLYGFLSNSGMNLVNYDILLTHLTTEGMSNMNNFGADGLEYCNQAAHDYLVNTLGWTITGDSLSSDCDNYINGTILYDETNDGCDSNDANVNGIMVHITGDIYDFSTVVQDGNYLASVSGTNFTVSVINYPDYFTANPASATVDFTTSDTEQVDFCITANQNVEDLNIVLLPIDQARPGFETEYQLVVANVGTQTIANATATLDFDDTMQSFVNAVPSPTSTTGNQLTFEMANLLPFESRTIELTMQTFTPPIVNGDDILSFTTAITPNANDYTPNDNTFNFDQIVVNSFDPNDKQVLQGEEISIDEADEYLDYIIRFQNTGTASAINVRVLDTLHPKLDYNTIQPIGSSHDYHVKITYGNQVEFIFDNIDLPHEAADEPGSNGYIAYKIKPIAGAEIGDVITGDARIYFDFNAPIITNTVSTEIVENLGITDHSALTDQLIVYPNPADKELNVKLTEGINLKKVTIYNLQGQEIRMIQNGIETINVENLTSGMYLLKIETDRGTLVRQLIKN